jgi:hypothetical protein
VTGTAAHKIVGILALGLNLLEMNLLAYRILGHLQLENLKQPEPILLFPYGYVVTQNR